MTDELRAKVMVEDVLGHYGRLDVLVNNAGVGLNQAFLTTTLDDWERQIRVNLTGTFLCAQESARAMVGPDRQRGVDLGPARGAGLRRNMGRRRPG